MLDCNHCPIALDEAPEHSKAPSLVVCQICHEVIEAVVYERPKQHKVRFVFTLQEVQQEAQSAT